jgi:hypothetical protein
MRFEPSANAQMDVLHFGKERMALIRIDGALRDPHMLVHYARDQAKFEAVTSNLYPGVRAPMPLDYVEGAVRALDPLIRSTYGISDAVLAKAECFFSIVTLPPEKLQPLQKVPHIDTTDPLHFAVVHFLCHGPFGGTAFYRQLGTGFETIGPEREASWSACRDEHLKLLPESAGYMDANMTGYEQLTLIPCQFDRLILYPSNMLHSGLIPPAMPLSADPMMGRLTANFFIAYRPA